MVLMAIFDRLIRQSRTYTEHHDVWPAARDGAGDMKRSANAQPPSAQLPFSCRSGAVQLLHNRRWFRIVK